MKPSVTPATDIDISTDFERFRAAYRAKFRADFEETAFHNDDFYAFQVLEKAIGEGAPALREIAQRLQDSRLSLLDGVETIDFTAILAPARSVKQKGGPAKTSDAPDTNESEKAGEAPTPVSERRSHNAKGSGHVRLGYREIVALSKMRNQYRKTFGVFFDTFEFTGNDLYARSLLASCLGSGNEELASAAAHFMADDGTPRFHHRKGTPDLEIIPA
jgi:hypothetical protein